MDGQGTKRRRNIAENFNRLSRAHERYRRQTDGRTMTYSEHELEFMFANKIDSCSAWGCTYKFYQKITRFFSAMGVQVHPLHPLATPMAIARVVLRASLWRAMNASTVYQELSVSFISVVHAVGSVG